MDEYIEREAVLKFIENGLNNPNKLKAFGHDAVEIMAEIQYMSVADVAPVVRCHHCQSHHWEQEPCHGKTVHYCKKLKAEVTADFFCAAGKRKDGE